MIFLIRNKVRLRTSPSYASLANWTTLWLNPGQRITGEITPDGLWAKLDITVGETYKFTGYALLQGSGLIYLDPMRNNPPPPPVVIPGKTVIGIHPALPNLPTVQDRFGLHFMDRGVPLHQEAFNLGCRSGTFMSVGAAREARAMGMAVILRKYIPGGAPPSPESHAESMGVDANDTLMLMGTNEADNISTSDLVTRFEWDRRFALRAHALYPKCFILIGSFSMGTPQLDNPEVARVWRETYGKFLNENDYWCGLNYHCYSARPTAAFPPAHAAVIDPFWLEMRMLRMAYDPAIGALSESVVCVGDESFVDVAGTGGSIGCGYGEQDVINWFNLRFGLFGDYPQMYVHNAFMTDPDRHEWAGYNVRGWWNLFSNFVWRSANKVVPRKPTIMRFADLLMKLKSPLPADWSPPSKELL